MTKSFKESYFDEVIASLMEWLQASQLVEHQPQRVGIGKPFRTV